MLTRPIPQKQRAEMSEDKFYKSCVLENEDCEGQIEWHHHFKYAGKRTDDKFGILPLCHFHHKQESKYTFILNNICKSRMTEKDKQKYSRKVW